MKKIKILTYSSLITLFLIGAPAFSAAPKAILFDVFGTCVMVNSSLIDQGERWSQSNGIKIKWEALVNAWITDHVDKIEAIREGHLPWMTVDQIHEEALERLLPQYSSGKKQFSQQDITTISDFWHSLQPWPDTISGLNEMHQRFELGPLSNGNESLLTDLANFDHMPWDVILSSDQIQHYKPDSQVYISASQTLNIAPGDLLLVAAHEYDLLAAKQLGWKTAFVQRSADNGGDGPTTNGSEFDYVATDFNDLANQLNQGSLSSTR